MNVMRTSSLCKIVSLMITVPTWIKQIGVFQIVRAIFVRSNVKFLVFPLCVVFNSSEMEFANFFLQMI
jgi:hypothetical protein